MPNRTEILALLAAHREELRRRFTVRCIGLFGSHVRETARPGSDVDILVEFDEPTFDHYMDLKFYLEERLGAPVDLVLRDTLKARLRPIIEREVVYA